MGTWNTGPFDNDTAAAWCARLDGAEPADRAGMIRHVLTTAADSDGPLGAGPACETYAAAAIAAWVHAVDEPMTSQFAPQFLRTGGSVAIAADTAETGARALDRVVADPQWRAMWDSVPDDVRSAAFTGVGSVRDALRA